MLVARVGENRAPEETPRDLVLESGRFVAPRFVGAVDRDAQLDRLVAIGVLDVRVHLERVHRAVDSNDGEGAYGALLDLFIATDERSTEVRRRALAWASMLLTRERRAFLVRNLEAGLDAGAAMPASRRSMRSRGIVGRTHLVVRAA